MVMSIDSSSSLLVQNDYSLSEEDLYPNGSLLGKCKLLPDWSGLVLPSESKYSGVYVFARKNAVSIVVLKSESLFCFNVTYFDQVQKTFPTFLEIMRKSVKDLNQSILYVVLPYEKMYKGTEEELNKLISSNFPYVKIENIQLNKNQRVTIGREKGNILQEHVPETFSKNFSRQIKKVHSVLLSRESAIKFSFSL